MRSPVGRVQGTTRPVFLGNGAVVTGRKPMLVVELRVASNRNVRDIGFWSARLGLGLRLVQEVAEEALEAYEAWGTPEALQRFVSFGFVRSYHLPVACRVAFQGQGGGEAKPHHRSPLPHAVQALRREDKRAAEAATAKRLGCDDAVRRHRLFA